MVRVAIICAALFWAGVAQAQQCRLALVLALDVSSSVDPGEYDLQREGLAAALNSPDVRHAILRGAPGDVALAVYEWSGRWQQTLHMDWTRLRTNGDIDQAVVTLLGVHRGYSDFPTAVGHGLAFGASVLQRAPKCARRVIDVSGDGINNHGYGPQIAYRHFPLQDVTVNGLVIMGSSDGVVEFYRNEVLRGTDAFVEVARGFDDFEAAMTRKLYREINDAVLGLADPAPLGPQG